MIEPLRQEALGLSSLFATLKHESKIKYDLQGIVRLLTYGRLLDPASKCATMDQNGKYLRPPVSSANDAKVYDALTVIARNAGKIIQRMNTKITNSLNRTTTTVFYDVTNFLFEIEHPDPDEVDGTGAVVGKGLRKIGVSKENRRQPIVQVGLFMDDEGIPLSFGMFPGNMLDHHTFRPAVERTVEPLKLNRFILVADRGMYSGANMCHVMDAGHGYIVAKSLGKSERGKVAWAVDPAGYTHPTENFRSKSRVVERTVAMKDGSKRRLREKIVVYWSKAYREREKHEHASFRAFLGKLKENPNGFRITAAQSRSLRRFIDKSVLDRKSGEILDGTKLVALDEMLALQGRYMPSVVEEVARLVADQTYRGAAEAFLRQQAFGISADGMRRMIAGLKEDALAFSGDFSRKTHEDAGERAPCVCVEADGTGAPMREGELTDVKGKNGKATTREIKVGGIFAASRSAKNEPHRDEGSTTCLATSDRAEAFAVRLRGEYDRRYDRRPPATLFLTDGAPWLRKIQETHFPFAFPILDLYHAIEHLKPVLTAMKLKEGTDEWKGRKQVGMHWTVNGLDPLLQVRTFAKSNRLEEFFDYRLRAVKMMRRVA